MYESSSCSISSSTFAIVTLFNFSYSSVGVYLMTVLICIFLMTNATAYHFMCLFDIHISTLVMICSKLLPIFNLGCFIIIEI